VINIHKTPGIITGITVKTTGIMKMIMGIMRAEIEMLKEKMNIIIPIIMIKGDMKNILTETITGTGHFMEGLIMVTEIKSISHIEAAPKEAVFLLQSITDIKNEEGILRICLHDSNYEDSNMVYF
jgi:hypothetical protein